MSYDLTVWNGEPDPIDRLPWSERGDARRALARSEFARHVGAVTTAANHDDQLGAIERGTELDRFNAVRLGHRFRNVERLAGMTADWIEEAAEDYEERCARTPAAAPFLASLLQATANVHERGIVTYGTFGTAQGY